MGRMIREYGNSPLETVLENGLRVLVQTLDYSPAAAVTLAYGVGSVMETRGTHGLSHFCEHMLFKGTPANGPGVYWRTVQSVGGRANAFTSRDLTAYYSILPEAGLEDILLLEADRMVNCSMDPVQVASERSVVLEEKLMTGRDSPDGAMSDALFRTAFRKHPYGRPVIGSDRDINAFTRKGVSTFYRRFYVPSNAVLSVVGPVDYEKSMDLVRRVFEDIPAGESPLIEPPAEPGQRKPRIVEMDHPSSLRRMSMGFRVPGVAHEDSPALSLLAIHLAAGRSSRFDEILVAQGRVLDISASTNSLVRPGLFSVHAVLPDGVASEEIESAIMDELYAIAEAGIPADRMSSLKDRRMAWSLITDTEPSGRSRRFAVSTVKCGDPLFYWNSALKACDVSMDQLAAVVRRYLVTEGSTIVRLTPDTTGNATMATSPAKKAEEQDLRPPDLIPPEEARVGDAILKPPSRSLSDGAEMRVLDNGMRLVLLPDRSFPIVSFAFSFPGGTSRESTHLAGLSEMTCEAMLYGTGDQESARFNDRMESIGSALDLTALNEFAGGSATVLRENTGTAVATIADLFIRPAFREVDVESVRRETLAGLSDWTSSPIGAAMDSFARLSTEPGSPSGVPTIETVKSITPLDIISFHRDSCRPGGSVLTVVGDFDPSEMGALVEDHLGVWINPDGPLGQIPEGRNSSASGVVRIPLEGREQIAVVVGAPAPPRLHEDTHAFMLLNGILGEGIGSRLGRRIREQAGLAYHVSSIYLPFLGRGRLAVLLLTSPFSSESAMDILERELDILCSGKVSSDELRLEKASSTGMHLLAGTQYGSISRMLMTYASLGLPLDYDRLSLERLLNVTAEDIRDAAVRWLGGGIRYTSLAGAVK